MEWCTWDSKRTLRLMTWSSTGIPSHTFDKDLTWHQYWGQILRWLAPTVTSPTVKYAQFFSQLIAVNSRTALAAHPLLLFHSHPRWGVPTRGPSQDGVPPWSGPRPWLSVPTPHMLIYPNLSCHTNLFCHIPKTSVIGKVGNLWFPINIKLFTIILFRVVSSTYLTGFF